MILFFRVSIISSALLGALLWPGCVSRTLPETRFAESEKLALVVTPPVLTNPNKFSFSTVGDLHLGATTWLEKMLALSAADGDAFAIMLGDLADQGTAEQVNAYHAAILASPLAGKVFSILGNHDIFADGWEFFKAKVGPSHYAFTVGNSRFVALDTADATLGSEQTEWLNQQLGGRPETNIFLLSHYSPIVAGVRSYLRFSDAQEAQALMKLATTRNVSAWLAAHYHSYVQKNIDGVSYLVAGGGGGRRMEPVLENFYVKVSVDGDQLSFERKRLDY